MDSDDTYGTAILYKTGYEYHLVSLNSPDGVSAVENRLNAWGAEGWRLTGVTVCNGNFAVMERARA